MPLEARLPSKAAARVAVALLAAACAASAGAATKTRQSLLYDPGPRHRCFDVGEENPAGAQGYETNPWKDDSECSGFFVPQRADENCRAFGAIMAPDTPTCPTWKFITYGWYYRKTPDAPSEFRVASGPGYDLRAQGGDGGKITATLVNDAAGKPDACTLREVTFAYEYPSSSFQRKPDWSAYTLGDSDRFDVSYSATISGLAPAQCASEPRTFLTTDLIYAFTDSAGRARTNVLSIIHFDAAGLTSPGTIFWNACDDSGCRVAVPGPQIPAGRKSRVSLEFDALLREYGPQLGHPGGVPPDAVVTAVQIVSSNRGSDATVAVRDVAVDMVTLGR